MKLVKILAIPAVLALSVALAVPAAAHVVNQATLTVACQSNTGKVCVTLSGEVQPGTDTRYVFLQLLAQGSSTVLDTAMLTVPAFQQGGDNTFTDTACFKANTDASIKGFVVQIDMVTSDKAGKLPADLTIDLANNQSVSFGPSDQETTPVGTTGPCTAPPPPPMSPSPSPSVQTVATLANTGGLDLRLPLIGLAVIVAGLALYVVSVGRGRSSAGR